MKRIVILVMLALTSLAAGCAYLPGPAPEPTSTFTLSLPTQDLQAATASGITVIAVTPLSPEPPTATREPPPSATEAPADTLTPTFGPSPALPATSTPQFTATPSGPRLDPIATWGAPNLLDTLDSPANWLGADSLLPDTPNLLMVHNGTQLVVTGRNLLFETWWFTWPTLRDFYLEMTVNTATCNPTDTYGLVLRGPPRGASTVRGYFYAFTCDGSFRLRRLDSTSPTFQAVDLIGVTPNTAIRAGQNQINVVGIQAVGSVLTLYANGYRLAEYTDPSYADGRYGIYVRSGGVAPYTFRVEEIAYWDLSD